MLSKEKRLPLACPAQCPAAPWIWGTWELWDVAEQGITTAVSPVYLAASIAHKGLGNHVLPWELSRERGKSLTQPVPPLHPCLCSLSHGRRGSRPRGQLWDSRVSQEWQQGVRVASVKTGGRQWPEKHGSRITRRLSRTAEGNVLLFHQLYSPLNDTGGCGMALQEVENHPFKKQSSPSPTGMRKGNPARIKILWQPNTHMTRILPIWNHSPQNSFLKSEAPHCLQDCHKIKVKKI